MRVYYEEKDYCTFGILKRIIKSINSEFDLAQIEVNGVTASSSIYPTLKTDLNIRIALLSQIRYIK